MQKPCQSAGSTATSFAAITCDFSRRYATTHDDSVVANPRHRAAFAQQAAYLN
jgi:hypothetical protein